ncbi:MAG TPA: hypothetical protein VLG50_06595 [Candidatus Saccharimonadales bacterium]|nr:hypothetical protein [Candidatus Saccharimonadales bacterium]
MLLNWLLSFFYETKNSTGPARNAPDSNINNIKKLIENKPPDVSIISEQDIITAKEKLKKVDISKINPIYTESDLMVELHKVFDMDYKLFFEQRRNRKLCHTTSVLS